MDTKRTGGWPDEGKDTGNEASWTNETLPLGIRRELLDRELQKLMARKRHGAASSAGGVAGHSEGASSGHPVADGPAGDDRAS